MTNKLNRPTKFDNVLLTQGNKKEKEKNGLIVSLFILSYEQEENDKSEIQDIPVGFPLQD